MKLLRHEMMMMIDICCDERFKLSLSQYFSLNPLSNFGCFAPLVVSHIQGSSTQSVKIPSQPKSYEELGKIFKHCVRPPFLFHLSLFLAGHFKEIDIENANHIFHVTLLQPVQKVTDNQKKTHDCVYPGFSVNFSTVGNYDLLGRRASSRSVTLNLRKKKVED